MPKKVSLQDSTMGELSDAGAFFAYGKYKEMDENISSDIVNNGWHIFFNRIEYYATIAKAS